MITACVYSELSLHEKLGMFNTLNRNYLVFLLFLYVHHLFITNILYFIKFMNHFNEPVMNIIINVSLKKGIKIMFIPTLFQRSLKFAINKICCIAFFKIIDRPEVSSNTTQLQLIEGHNCTLECKVTAANPYSSITWKWFRTDIPNTVLYNRSTYTIHSIKRDKSGSYSCTASNSIGQSKAVEIYLDVQCKFFL